MFTGIVREIGTVTRIERSAGLVRVSIAAPATARGLEPMESVCVSGVCLTVVAARGGVLVFEMIPETQALTSLGGLRRGDRVNLEPSLSLADRLNGHLVFGHVDAVGRVARRRERAGELTLWIRMPAALRRWVVPKGPIAVDGTSLTVGQDVRGGVVSVHLIPETLRRTTLGSRRVGDPVNLEADYAAKVIGQAASSAARRLSGR
jgi:riboflavin synthase